MKRMPPYRRDEYNDISQDLKGAFAILEVEGYESEIHAKTREAALIRRSKISGEELRTAFLHRVVTEKKRLKAEHLEERCEQLQHRLNEWQRGWLLHEERKQSGLLDMLMLELMWMYAEFNPEKFSEEFRAAFVDDCLEKKSRAGRVNDLNKEMKTLRGKIQKIVSEAHTWFVVMPKGPTGINEKCLRRMRRFLEDYRERALFFDVPVTVTGVLIESLGPKRRKVWMELYEKSGIRKQLERKLRAGYQGEFEPHQAVPDDEDLPEVPDTLAKPYRPRRRRKTNVEAKTS